MCIAGNAVWAQAGQLVVVRDAALQGTLFLNRAKCLLQLRTWKEAAQAGPAPGQG